MKGRHRWLKGIIAVAAAVILLTLAYGVFLWTTYGSGTEERIVAYENHARMTLKIDSDGTRFILMPDESAGLRQKQQQYLGSVKAYDQDGRLRFEKNVTWSDLKQSNFKVVILENVH